MNYTKPSFSVPASSAKSDPNCLHLWKDTKRKRCVLCGAKLPEEAGARRDYLRSLFKDTDHVAIIGDNE